MRIGILLAEQFTGDAAETLGPYEVLFQTLLDGHGFSYLTYPVHEGVFPASPLEAEGWLITGSTAGAYDDLPWIAPLEGFIRAVEASGRPLVGICFGHQIIAQAFGGKVEKFAGGWRVGRETYDIDGAPVPLFAWHQDQVVKRPPGARCIGHAPGCENAVLEYGSTILSLQPRPEFTPREIRFFARYMAGGSIPDRALAAAHRSAAKPTNSGRVARRIARHFLKNRP